jgi:serine/threonine protein kinase
VYCPRCSRLIDDYSDDEQCPHCGCTLPPPESDELVLDDVSVASLRPGEQIDGKWKLVRVLGRGGMGTVWLADDLNLDRRVAIKVLPSRFCGNEELIGRFMREARLTARLEHANIVPVHAVGRHAGRPYIVMSLLDGQNLFLILKRRRRGFPPAEILELMRQICSALGFIHAQGFVHRDVKPGNIFIGKNNQVWILDFGVLRDVSGSGVTRGGVQVGTPRYMSPEQIQGNKPVDRRADLYSLGVVFFEMLTGQRPFFDAKGATVARMHLEREAPPANWVAPWVPPELAAVASRALKKDPEERFQSANEFLAAVIDAVENPEEETIRTPAPGTLKAPVIDRSFALSDAAQTLLDYSLPRPAGTGSSKRKVLLVDQSAVALQAARVALEGAGFTVATLDDPLALVSAVREELPDLILLDINVPQLAGDALMGIVGQDEAMTRTPIVLHSDLAADVLELRAKGCGAAGFIRKTASAEQFVEQVGRWLP